MSNFQPLEVVDRLSMIENLKQLTRQDKVKVLIT